MNLRKKILRQTVSRILSMRNSLFLIFHAFTMVTSSSEQNPTEVPECITHSRYVAIETDDLKSEIDVVDDSRLSIKFSGWWYGDTFTLGTYSRIDEFTYRVWLSPDSFAERESLYFVMQSMAVDMDDGAFEIVCLPSSSYLRVGRLLYK